MTVGSGLPVEGGLDAAAQRAGSQEAVSQEAVAQGLSEKVAGTAGAGGGVAATESVAAAGLTYPVVAGYRLNVRSGPTTSASRVRVLEEGARVRVLCQTTGERVTGPCGTSSIWDAIGPGEYVSDTYVRTGSDGYVAGRCR